MILVQNFSLQNKYFLQEMNFFFSILIDAPLSFFFIICSLALELVSSLQPQDFSHQNVCTAKYLATFGPIYFGTILTTSITLLRHHIVVKVMETHSLLCLNSILLRVTFNRKKQAMVSLQGISDKNVCRV